MTQEMVPTTRETKESSSAVHSECDTIRYNHFIEQQAPEPQGQHVLKAPTLQQLLGATFSERQFLLFPWLREQESCMVYAETGVGKSLFALSAALAIAGGGEYLGWKPNERANGAAWRVLYIDGEMHIGDIQERARMLLHAVPSVDKKKANANLRFLARQHQDPEATFPLISESAGMKFIRECARKDGIDLVILDNFSTLGEVQDENAASSFNSIQQFLLQLKVAGVATMLVHHANKTAENFRGSSKLAATFETIIKLERLGSTIEHGAAAFRARWDKVRAGGPKRKVREVAARLIGDSFAGREEPAWEYEAAEIERLDDLKERLANGEFISQKEIADHCGVSPTMAGKYVKKGLLLGLWTNEEVGRAFARGKAFRTQGKTHAPIRPSTEWQREQIDEATNVNSASFDTAFD